jgi:hypothetical protein
VGGRRAVRDCIVNHRTRDEDLTILLDALRRLASSEVVGIAIHQV